MNTTPTTSALEPQTAAYQAAVDNVWLEIEYAARDIKNAWNVGSGTSKYDRWDYEMYLEQEILRHTTPVRWNLFQSIIG